MDEDKIAEPEKSVDAEAGPAKGPGPSGTPTLSGEKAAESAEDEETAAADAEAGEAAGTAAGEAAGTAAEDEERAEEELAEEKAVEEPAAEEDGGVEVERETVALAAPETEPEAEPEAEPEPAAAFAHAPTSGGVRHVGDETLSELDEAEEPEEAEEAPAAGIDRRPDVLSWVLTPVLVLVLGPLLAGAVAVLVATSETGYPALCRSAAADNRCEEVVLRMAGQHAVAFVVGWALVWALPWWRGLRAYRIALGVLVVLLLVAAPLRLVSTMDYDSVLGLP
ncbi:hypothetical protein ACQP2F_10980 [Actinoplanes sp. CA-030573]|uniref:hypothetical protein n=1 Tax=Actinoplanes sp. CA-030573 TaxID=3239898 RepID=UPI003D8E3683